MPVAKGTPRVIFELFFKKNGKISKRIQFLEDNVGYSVIEQNLIINRFAPVGKPDIWDTSFFLPSTQRNIAKTVLMGRLSACAYEEGNKGDD